MGLFQLIWHYWNFFRFEVTNLVLNYRRLAIKCFDFVYRVLFMKTILWKLDSAKVWNTYQKQTLHKKWSFLFRISSVNVTIWSLLVQWKHKAFYLLFIWSKRVSGWSGLHFSKPFKIFFQLCTLSWLFTFVVSFSFAALLFDVILTSFFC